MPGPTYESNYIFPRRMLFFHANRSALLIRGLVFLVLGLIGLFRPIHSLAAVTIILGVFLLMDAMGALFLSIACRRLSGVFWSILLCAAGIAMIVRPVDADKLIVIVLGFWLIITGAEELLSTRISSRKIILSTSGILSLVVGILLVVAPFAGIAAVSWLVAILLLISGAGMLLLAWGLRSAGLPPGERPDGDN